MCIYINNIYLDFCGKYRNCVFKRNAYEILTKKKLPKSYIFLVHLTL